MISKSSAMLTCFVLYLCTLGAGVIVRPANRFIPDPPARPSIEELIVDESLADGMPPDLALQLAWEESRMNPWAARHDSHDTWSMGIFQINGCKPVFELDIRRQIHDGVVIAAGWWVKTHDRRRTKRAFRRGRL